MEFKVNSKELKQAITKVRGVTGSPISHPAIEYIHAKADADRVSFMATNLNLTAISEVEADVQAGGEILFPPLCVDVFHDLPDGDVSIRCNAEKIAVSVGRFKSKLTGLSAELYPVIERLETYDQITMEAEQLASAIRFLLPFTSTDKSRFELDGIFWVLEKHRMEMVATDGRRLGIVWNGYPEDSFTDKHEALVSTHTCETLLKTLPKSGVVIVRFAPRRIEFDVPGQVIQANLLTPYFPQYHRIIPTEQFPEFTVERKPMIEALRRVAKVTDTELCKVRMKFNGDTITIDGEYSDKGAEGEEQLEYRPLSDETLPEMLFNVHYMLDHLTTFKGDILKFGVCQLKPIIITCDEEPDRKALVQPIRPPEEDES